MHNFHFVYSALFTTNPLHTHAQRHGIFPNTYLQLYRHILLWPTWQHSTKQPLYTVTSFFVQRSLEDIEVPVVKRKQR